MKVKKFISIFLILVLSLQLLPIRQMVSWLLTSQPTEELVHNNDSGKQNPGLDELHKNYLDQGNDLSVNLLISSFTTAHAHSESLFNRHADDIPTPPPNC